MELIKYKTVIHMVKKPKLVKRCQFYCVVSGKQCKNTASLGDYCAIHTYVIIDKNSKVVPKKRDFITEIRA